MSNTEQEVSPKKVQGLPCCSFHLVFGVCWGYSLQVKEKPSTPWIAIQEEEEF